VIKINNLLMTTIFETLLPIQNTIVFLKAISSIYIVCSRYFFLDYGFTLNISNGECTSNGKIFKYIYCIKMKKILGSSNFFSCSK